MLKKAAVVFALCIFATSGWAEVETFVLQSGLNGYLGVEDTFLYAPPSVADINYGLHSQLTTGRNRWDESYVALIRFNLPDIPRDAKVIQATLCLHDQAKEWPSEEIVMQAHSPSPANTGWTEGNNEGTRIPAKGTSCWNWLAYGQKRWAGQAGLSEKGVDFTETSAGSATIEPDHEGWLEFELRPEVVQQWLGKEHNPGLVLRVQESKNKGQVVTFASSDLTGDKSIRPKLELKLEIDNQSLRFYMGNQGIRALENLKADFASVVEAKIGPREDAGGAVGEVLSDFEGRMKGIERILENRKALSRDHLSLIHKDIDRCRDSLANLSKDLVLAQAADFNRERSLNRDFTLGVADSMTNVLREPAKLEACFIETAEISMARNEFESLQIVLVPIDKEIKQAEWSVTDLCSENGDRIPGSDISIQVMGYMKSLKPAIESDSEWWPVPILDFMESVDVPRGEVQPLWITVHTQEDTPAGTYSGTVEVKASGSEARQVKLNVQVWDFAVPKEQHLMTFWGNAESAYSRLYGERYDKKMAKEMFQFLLDHRLAVNSLYSQQSAGEPKAGASVGYPTLSDPAELKSLWEAGSRWWNLGYIHPVFAERAGKSMDEYVPDFIEMLKESLRVADAAGWPRSNMTIYLFDETKEFELLDRVARRVGEAFPDILLMTTAYDRSYGVKGGPIDKSIDIWCPLTPVFVEEMEAIEKAREIGKKIWWYVCCVPRANTDLNFFCQLPAVRSRLLMGTANWKYKPDGFLYYRISGWNHYRKPIDSGPLTDWKPYFLPGPDGDGELICPGPNGPLSTLQFENIRDGIEDYEYFWVLNDLITRVKEKGIDVDAEAELLNIPEDLMQSIARYSEDPARLRDQRSRVAEAIVKLSRNIEQ